MEIYGKRNSRMGIYGRRNSIIRICGRRNSRNCGMEPVNLEA